MGALNITMTYHCANVTIAMFWYNGVTYLTPLCIASHFTNTQESCTNVTIIKGWN